MLGSIQLEAVTRCFKTFARRPGLQGAFLDLFQRQYSEIKALDDVSLTVHPGERVGYIGPNGAGKSTTAKLIAGILLPTEGRVRVNGLDPWRQRRQHCRRIGVLFGQRSQLEWNLPVIESFRFLKDIYAIPDRLYRDRLGDVVEALELQPLLRLPVRELSLGQRTRCELAAIFLHRPTVVLLDEPTMGLDLMVKRRVREFLKKLNVKGGTTLFLTSHDLQDVEGIVNRLIVIDKGRLLFDGSLEVLRRHYSPYAKRIVLRFKDSDLLQQARQRFDRMKVSPLTACQDMDRLSLTLTLKQEQDWQALLSAVPLTDLDDLAVEDPRIEEIVLEIYRRRNVA